ncbi:MAG: histidinol-phosphatase HisJ family protein [Turicibacter sp.]|nr:histidinol-phosphatase HisJ family protein [Turicibacter sp.]
MRADYHVHTAYSDDSEYPMEEVVKDAIEMGLEEICFTDHVDYGVKSEWGAAVQMYNTIGEAVSNVDYPRYFAQLDELREKYRDQITIKRGLEFGIQMHTIADYEKLFNEWEMDFVILSVHQVNDEEFWTFDYQDGKTQQAYNDGYYQELYDVVTHFHDYSVLGHLDLMKRYDKAGLYPFEKSKEMITKILTYIIGDGKGIELNTSSFRYGLSDLMPSRDILELYHALGGTILTIGSDSHQKEHLGAHIEACRETLKEIGFTQFCTFEKMQPIFHDL